MKSFKIFLSESNIFQNKYIDNHTVKLMSKSEPIMNAWLKAGFKVGDQFTTQQSYTGKTKEVELSNGKGKESMILKTSANEYIKVIGFKTAITSSLHHVNTGKKKDKTGIQAIPFSDGKKTKMGESIQCVGFVHNHSISKPIKFGDAHYTAIVNTLKTLNLSGGQTAIDEYFKDEDTFNQYMVSIVNLVAGASSAVSQLGMKVDGVVHDEINEYYEIAKSKNYITGHTKQNTADCVIYTGSNFLKNFEKGEVVYESHLISIIVDSKVTNTFYQVSLKNAGRLGDIATLNVIANQFKGILYTNEENIDILDNGTVILDEGYLTAIKSVLSGTKTLISKGKKLILKGLDRLKDLTKSLLSGIKRLSKIGDSYHNKLMKAKPRVARYLALTEGRKTPLPKEYDILVRYGDEEGFATLKSGLIDTNKKLTARLSTFSSDDVVYKIDDYNVDFSKITNIVSQKKGVDVRKEEKFQSELRLLYYNYVSALTALKYIESIKSIKDFHGLEIEAIYGNTSLPLIKITGHDTGSLERLKINPSPTSETSSLPAFAIQATLSGHHMAYYFHVLSVTKENPQYMQVQLRTKGSAQYVVDANVFITIDKFNTKYK